MTAVAKSDAREARERAGRIRVGMVQYLHTLADVAAAYAARDWLALGYESWDAYVDGEYGAERLRLSPEHRQKAVAELRMAGLSQRAIGTALGVNRETVAKDLREVAGNQPPEIQGADGKMYAATRPQSPAAVPPEESTPDSAPAVPAAVSEASTAPTVGAGDSTVETDDETPQGDLSRDSADTSPAPVEGTGAGEVTPDIDPNEALVEWRRQFAERAADVREGREAFATFARDFPPDAMAICAGPYEAGLMAALQASHSDGFAAALDRLVPDPNPNREWQRRFLEAISGMHKLMRFRPEDVAERADETCVDELVRIRTQFEDYFEAVIKARIDSTPDNVTPIRRIS